MYCNQNDPETAKTLNIDLRFLVMYPCSTVDLMNDIIGSATESSWLGDGGAIGPISDHDSRVQLWLRAASDRIAGLVMVHIAL